MFSSQEELEIKERLAEVTSDVKLILFSQQFNCESCPEMERLIRALVPLSDKLKLEEYNPAVDREKAAEYGITRVPALVLEGDKDYGIRFFGIPGGYEFASLLEDIISIGNRKSGLSEASIEKIQALTEPLNLKVFVTPG